jgi:hypothetical protein
VLGARSIEAPRVIPPGAAERAAADERRGRRPDARPLAPGDAFVVDALVGQINGRPIFAEEFFEPLADRLRAIGRDAATRTAFVQQALPIIRLDLERRVDQALYLAEAEAALSPEERRGLRFWLAELQGQTVARRGGSRAEADLRLRTEENRTLEEEIQRMRDEGLQSKLIREEILPRVIVSKYEIEREYERRYDEFNPPPSTTIERLIVRQSREDTIEAVNARLEQGESILEIADELVAAGDGIRSELGQFAVRPAGLSESEAVSELFRRFTEGWEQVGDWGGPMSGTRSVSWFFVSRVDEQPGRPLFDEDVQRILKAELRNRKIAEELGRYEARLRQESIVSEEQEMLRTLLEIAVRRYGPS